MVVTGDLRARSTCPRGKLRPRSTRSSTSSTGSRASAVMRFAAEDVVRHPLVERIVKAYDEHSQRQAPELRPAQQPRRQSK